MTLQEFQSKLEVGSVVSYDLIEDKRRTGKTKEWKITERDITEYFSKLSEEEYRHHNFKI